MVALGEVAVSYERGTPATRYGGCVGRGGDQEGEVEGQLLGAILGPGFGV